MSELQTCEVTMSEAIVAALVTTVHMVEWDNRTLLILSNDRVVTLRGNYWGAAYCTADRTNLQGDLRCDDYATCPECWVTWDANVEEQGSKDNYYSRKLFAVQSQLEQLQERVATEYIEISKVQQVAHDYAVHGEWCSVYEQAMESLGIEPLSVSDDITVTITVNMHVEASRRQRAGDLSFMRESITWGMLERGLGSVSWFDGDYEESDISLIDVSIDLQ